MESERRMSGLLLIGMLTIPAAAVWLFLRHGYPRDLRRTAFIFAAVMTAVPAIGRLS